MKKLYLLFFCALLCSLFTFAQFSGGYAPSKWATFKSSGAGIVNSGSVDASGAPSTITITGSDDPSNPLTGTPVDIDYTITAAASGTWSFNWSYATHDQYNDPQYDLAGVLIGGAFTQLSTNTVNLINQSGTFSVSVTAGTVIGFRISATDNSYGNATFTISGFSAPATTLPVVLKQFTATPKAGKTCLTWSATSEINTAQYVIERSQGNDFEKIGTVQANSSTSSYSFTDASPHEGTNYYRLRMVDKDGTFSFSPIKTVKFSSLSQLQLYPNPASTTIQVSLKSEHARSETLELCNAAGSLLRTRVISMTPGMNRVELDISTLPNGLYDIRAKGTGWVQSFIKN